MTQKSLLDRLAYGGFGKEELLNLQQLINAEKSDLFYVLEYVSFAINPIQENNGVLMLNQTS